MESRINYVSFFEEKNSKKHLRNIFKITLKLLTRPVLPHITVHQKVTSTISSVSRLYFLTSTSSPVLIIISRTRSMAATWFKHMALQPVATLQDARTRRLKAVLWIRIRSDRSGKNQSRSGYLWIRNEFEEKLL
jgi:hypothetical protein